MLNIRIVLQIGDEGGDGHMQTAKHTFLTNVSKERLVELHDLGAQTLGVRFCDLCSDYGDNELPLDNPVLCDMANQIVTDSGHVSEFTEWGTVDGPLHFALLYMEVAKLGADREDFRHGEDFRYVYMSDRPDSLHIGGYGLWSF